MQGSNLTVESIYSGATIITEENVIGYASKPLMSKLSSESLKDVFYLKVKGDSMDRLFPNGSYVLVRKNAFVQNGDFAIVLIDGKNDAFLRKLKTEDHYLHLIPVSYNKEHSKITVDTNKNSVQIIGEVIGCFTYQ